MPGTGKAVVQQLLQNSYALVNVDVKANVPSVEEVQHLYSFISSTLGKPNMLVCNAGKGILEKLSKGNPEKGSG